MPPPGFEDDVVGDIAAGSTSTQPVGLASDEFSVLLPPPAEFPPDPEVQPEMEAFDVMLVKDHQGLGITIAGYVCEKGKFCLNHVSFFAVGTNIFICITFRTFPASFSDFCSDFFQQKYPNVIDLTVRVVGILN